MDFPRTLSKLIPKYKSFGSLKKSLNKVLYCKSCRNSYSNSSRLYSTRPAITSVYPVKDDLRDFHRDIIKLLQNDVRAMNETCQSYFDGKGKSIRPATVYLMARMCNNHVGQPNVLTEKQRKVGMIAEMIHVGSLMHDDVVDSSNVRRGKKTVNYLLGDKNAVMAGNYVVSTASILLSTIDNHEVSKSMSAITKDLVDGEIMQQSDGNHFEHYLKKTYKKTASLFSHCCKSVAILSGCDDVTIHQASQYGENLGLAFQIVDDVLDFDSNTRLLGKPAVADLKLGLATAPVLYARENDSTLNKMINRRFKNSGDVDYALNKVLQTGALEKSRELAMTYCDKAKKNLDTFDDCLEKDLLLELPDVVFDRTS